MDSPGKLVIDGATMGIIPVLLICCFCKYDGCILTWLLVLAAFEIMMIISIGMYGSVDNPHFTIKVKAMNFFCGSVITSIFSIAIVTLAIVFKYLRPH